MPMSRPSVQNIITTGQLLNAALSGAMLVLGIVVAVAWWVFGKDKTHVDLGAKVDAVGAQVAKMDGKLEAYSTSFNGLSNRVDLLDQRQQASDAAAKEGR